VNVAPSAEERPPSAHWGKERFQNQFAALRGVKHRSSFGVPPLGKLTPSAERRNLSLALAPAATQALIDLVEIVLAPVSG